ncbi:MAG: response regulator [Treponema sp.]|jgi:signal transduction histidine kinase/CheY-like chemotaxis protein|nr:response regulator [Treponema sp.]
MKKINNVISRYIFSDELPLKGRVFNLVLSFGILAEFISLIVRAIEGVSSIAVYIVAGMILVTGATLWFCNKIRRYTLGTWLAVIIVCDIFFPLLFFFAGGVSGGMAGYFVLCIVLIFFLLKQKECIVMLLVHLAIMAACYTIGRLYPATVTGFKSDFSRYLDIMHTIIVAGLLTGFLLKYQNRIYEMEKAKAEAASRAKADFLANVSHEIRTPLNAIIGLGELELDKNLPADTVTNLEKMHNSGMSLLSIINDLLDISKIEAGHFELIPVEYQTPSFINDTVNLNMVRIGSKPITFRLDIDENLPFKLYGDEIRLRQILNNLLSNAFKYTKEGTVVLRIRCEPFEKADGTVSPVYSALDKAEKLYMVCSVEDTGMGIRPEDIGKLFSLYKQVDTEKHRHIEGTGLGLSICKNLVELMGGAVSVQSEYGAGSIFTVRIPQRIMDSAPLGREMVDNLARFRFAAKKRERRKTILNPMPYGAVLVVDDVETNLDVAKGMMMPYGLTIDCVASGKEAIQLVRDQKTRYDAIFMDHMMPGMDGIEAVKIIREEIDDEYARTVPVIALTANALIGNDKMFLENGFQDFLTKPIDMTKLDAILNKWIRNREKEQQPKWAALIEKMKTGGEAEAAAAPAVPQGGTDKSAAPQDGAAGSIAAVIAGIDYAGGVKRMGNREAAYIRVLTSYSANMPTLLAKIRGFTGQNLADYIITVHGIKGSSYGICAEAVGKQAEALEMAGKSGDIETILAMNDGFILQTEKLVADIRRYVTAL